jgi:glyoxylase-like metal-dependent hydrolase (beta-lactamase superfamily II)
VSYTNSKTHCIELRSPTPPTDNIFCGDSVFNADLGVARCEFPGGSAKALYHSTHKLLSLPDHVKIFTGHDYPSSARIEPVPYMSVAEQRERNAYLQDELTEEAFVKKRTQRDSSLNEPKLFHQSLQVNIRGGRLPKKLSEEQRFLVLPLRVGVASW